MKFTETDALRAAQIVYENASKAKKIAKGYSHEIYEVETGSYPRSVIVRFSNNKEPECGLKKEIRVHKILQKLGIPVPRVILHDESKKRVPFEFVILSKLEGMDLDKILKKLSRKEQEEIMEKVGELLGRIHTIKFNKLGFILPKGIKEKAAFSLKLEGKQAIMEPGIKTVLAEFLEDLGTLASFDVINPKFLLKLSEYLLENKNFARIYEKPTLNHGDFYDQNIKVKKIDGKWQITGLIDFELAASRMKEYDFIKLKRNGFLESGYLKDALLQGYKKFQTLDNDFDKKVNYFTIGRDAAFSVYLLKSGNIDYAKKILENIKKKIGFDEEVFIK
jgi:Ser/Thr protein kinase RdoA (MazF antagonist)